MPSQQSMLDLSQLLEQAEYTHKAAMRTEDEYHKGQFIELTGIIYKLALHIKQLQLEVLKLAELYNKPPR